MSPQQGLEKLEIQPTEDRVSVAMVDPQSSAADSPKPADGEVGELSPSALKKLAKAKEKEEKKLAKKRELEEKQKLQAQSSAASDFAKHNYGDLPANRGLTVADIIDLPDISKASEGTVVIFQARVQNIRSQTAKLCFLLLRHGSSTIQAVVAAEEDQGDVSRQMVKWVSTLNPESFMEITGIVKTPKESVNSATISNLELHVRKIYVVAGAIASFPMQLESALLPELAEGEAETTDENSKSSKTPKVSLKTRLDNRVVDLRTPTNAAITRIKNGVSELFQEYLRSHGFTQIFTPKLMAAASEGGANAFAVSYFERVAYLAQSPQLHKQMAIGGDLERVFEIGPVFRAEKSNTHRHMTEFVGLDLEMTFKIHYHEVLALLEGLFIHIFSGLRTRYADEIAIVRRQYPVEEFLLPAPGQPMLRLTFAEGVALLRSAGTDVADYEDLSTQNERLLGKLVREKYHTDFFIMDEFPLAVRPFYTMPNVKDPKNISNSYDFFMRGEEIMSGAQRVHQHDLLVERMKVFGVDPDGDGIKDYVESFRYGTPPHAGGGIGLERVVFLYLGLGNIRKASMFPRDPQRLRP